MLLNDNEYLKIVEQIKGEIAKAQYKATLSVNRELILLYYNIGKVINENKTWGSKFIDNLAKDIKLSYPKSTGYSVRNLKYMAKFAENYSHLGIEKFDMLAREAILDFLKTYSTGNIQKILSTRHFSLIPFLKKRPTIVPKTTSNAFAIAPNIFLSFSIIQMVIMINFWSY